MTLSLLPVHLFDISSSAPFFKSWILFTTIHLTFIYFLELLLKWQAKMKHNVCLHQVQAENRTHSKYTKWKELTGRNCLQKSWKGWRSERGKVRLPRDYWFRRPSHSSDWKAKGQMGFRWPQKGCAAGVAGLLNAAPLQEAKHLYSHWCLQEPHGNPDKGGFYDMGEAMIWCSPKKSKTCDDK